MTAFDERSPDEVVRLLDAAFDSVISPAKEPVVAGWTRSALQKVLDRLREGYPGQVAVIEAGLQRSDGKVPRDTAARLAEKGDRAFNGFTKPVARTVEALKDEGIVEPNAVALLKAYYGEGGKAEGFQVPAELSDLR